ncbi:MAG: RNA polymerase sigma-70 factor [Acidobacteria bacterium]|nr:RNA polymerase sigma-70 factor [Acidobacteriota bacterium]
MSTDNRVYEIGTSASVSADTSGTDRLEIFHAQRPRLFSIAYRMLGSVADAEDILQEAFIRWQQSSVKEIRSPEAFLVTIVSRLCLNHLQSARVKREEYFGQWLPEPILTAEAAASFPDPTMDDSLSMAFLVLLERLTPLERAVFLLREVFDYDYTEIARIVEQTSANCRQILRRARQHLKHDRPRFDASPQQHEQLLHRFLEASSSGDMAALLAIISDDIVLYADGGGRANAVPNPVYGADNVVRFLLGVRKKFLPSKLIRQVMQINGKPGIVGYLEGRPYGVITISVVEGRIRNIYIVSNPEKLDRLPNLPSTSC